MWKDTEKNLGNLKVGQEVRIEFEHEEGVVLAKNFWGKADIMVSCGCTSAVYDKKSRKVVVKFTPQEVSPEIKALGENSYETSKKITVYTLTPQGHRREQVLTFKGIVSE
jgi:hypothetical protein